MKKEYDFSKAERGRFYRKGAKLRLPIYLDTKLQTQVQDLANRTGREVGDVVNRIVEKEVRVRLTNSNPTKRPNTGLEPTPKNARLIAKPLGFQDETERGCDESYFGR